MGIAGGDTSARCGSAEGRSSVYNSCMRHGSRIDPPNRFEQVHAEPDYEQFELHPEDVAGRDEREIEYLSDSTQSIVSENDSPDVPFRYSVNPYRGCVHGCAYCYARPSHEFLGLNAGLDFETRILVKHDAPALLRKFLSRPGWRCEPITFSGVTDCYQPAEREYHLTRQCLEVAWEYRQPVSLITKNALVLRDLDLLAAMAKARLVHTAVSITTLDAGLARDMEPRTSTPQARLRTIRELAAAGVPVAAMLAPIVPGLTDSEIPALLEAVAAAGAHQAGYVLVRLPLVVEPVFREWLVRTQPSKAEKIEGLIRQTRGGRMNRSTWGQRMVGTGPIAQQIRAMFEVFRRQHAFVGLPEQDVTQFRVPPANDGQLRLF